MLFYSSLPSEHNLKPILNFFNPYMTEGVGEKLKCDIKCALSNFHEVLLKRFNEDFSN